MKRILFSAAVATRQRQRYNDLLRHLVPYTKRSVWPVTSSCSSFFSTTIRSDNAGTEDDDGAAAETDVLIVGGGVVGCSLARSLLRLSRGLVGGDEDCGIPPLKIGLVEAGSGPDRFVAETGVTGAAAGGHEDGENENKKVDPPHPRSYALSPSSLEILGLADGNHRSRRRLGRYQSMQIWEANQPASLIFTSQDIDDIGKRGGGPDLGAVVEDSVILESLWSDLVEMGGGDHDGAGDDDDKLLRIWNETVVSEMELPVASHLGPAKVVLRPNQKSSSSAAATAANPKVEGKGRQGKTTTVSTRLLVAADGGNSWIRQQAGIGWRGYDYGQSAITFTVELAKSHGGRAFQRFLLSSTPNGGVGGECCQPLALLPTHSPHHAVVVWSTTPEQVQHWKDHPELVDHLNRLLQEGPGRLPPLFQRDEQQQDGGWSSNLSWALDKVVEVAQYGPAMAGSEIGGRPWVAPPAVVGIASPRFSFPLQCRVATRYTGPRLALVGDACHTVHPLAGQGLNLGLQDAMDLSDCITTAAAAGMDVATHLHGRYERSRRRQVGLTVSGIHAVYRLFGQDYALAKHAKSLGMNAIQNLPFVRRALVRAACQGVALAPPPAANDDPGSAAAVPPLSSAEMTQ